MESELVHPCPQCKSDDKLRMLTMSTEIPYFGEHTQITIICDSCGWKHTDFIPSEGEKPGLWKIKVDGKEKMSARIIRSSSCTIRIESLDLEVSPGSGSSGYVSNVEGVLNRFIDAIAVILNDCDEETIVKAKGMISLLEDAIEGKGSLVIELLDPRGRSQIVHDEAENRELTDEEAESLQMGFELPVNE